MQSQGNSRNNANRNDSQGRHQGSNGGNFRQQGPSNNNRGNQNTNSYQQGSGNYPQGNSNRPQGQNYNNRSNNQQQGYVSNSNRPQGQGYNNRSNNQQQGYGSNSNRPQGQGYNNRQGFNPNPNFSRPGGQKPFVNSGKEVAEGSKFEIEVNYLDMILNPKVTCAYHYDVKIMPDRPKKFMRPAFEKFCSTVFPNALIAYDGKASCYSITKLDRKLLATKAITVSPEVGKPMEMAVTLTETKDSMVDLTALKSYQNNSISEKPMRALQCLEVALIQPCHKMGVRSGRSFYYQPQRPQDLGSGYELWYGLFQSVILGERLLFNIDVSHKAFMKPVSVIDMLQSANHRGRNNSNDNSLYGILKNKDIVYTPPKEFNAASKSFKLFCLGNSADSEFFDLEDKPAVGGSKAIKGKKRRMSIQQYYREKGYEIKFPNYKLLKTKNGACYPMELCKIAEGQSDDNSSSKVVSQIVKYAASNTQERKAKIMELFKHFHGTRSPIIERFGVTLGDKFIRLEASRLFAPNISYRGGNLKPFKGKWNLTDNLKFLEPAAPVPSPLKWAIVNLDQYTKRGTLENSSDKLVPLAFKMGICLEKRAAYFDPSSKSVQQIFDSIKSDGYQFALVVLGDYGEFSYAKVKQRAELQCGVVTQCIKSATIANRFDNSTINNILLKLNAKLNGVNHKVDSNSNPPLVANNYVMFVGADVTHPSPQQRTMPSVVGVVSSTDSSGAMYNMQHFYQEPRKEIILDMKEIMVEHIKLYAKNNKGCLPTHIFYYRDGVADGQFEQVKEDELKKGMEFAFAEVAKLSKTVYKPKLICIIVQKRNHTRLFPLENGPSFGRMLNVYPGTVVDKVICHPKMKEFFLVSHESGLGTAKPAKYIVIRDDANVKLDDIQKLTYNLCHLFPRCNKAVSYPAPAYLAHLVAARGKVYIDGDKINIRRLSELQKSKTVIKQIKDNNPMFFV
ncbi:AGO2.2 family protein [Megaselia abdita]